MVSTNVLRLTLLAATFLAVTQAQRMRQRQRQERPGHRKTDGTPRQTDITDPPAAFIPGAVCSGEESFELITGFVYSSSEEILYPRVGTLLISDCLEYCRENVKCRALNFETGLCVLFKSAAGEESDRLAVSQLPVFTLYAQKVCVPAGEPRCASPWAYESVPDLALGGEYLTGAHPRTADSRSECANLCLTETSFTCRSVSYNSTTKVCVLSMVNRNMVGRKHLLSLVPGDVFVEMGCVFQANKMCEFKQVPGRILKTVDAVYQDLETADECKERCMKSNFTCYSYDFMSSNEKICRLSHHSEATLAHIQQPYLLTANATTYELQACYHITVECRASEMLARISMSTLFDGKVYSKGRPNSCRVDVGLSTDFNITLPYNDVRCDVNQSSPSTFSTNIVIQHHDMIVTSADVGLVLHCRYDIRNQTVTNSYLPGLEVKSAGETAEFFEETVVESPNVIMRVTDAQGLEDIVSAQVGESLALRFEITDRNSPYEIFVRELVAMDGRDNSEILLIDSNGCPTEPSIMEHVLQLDGSGKVLIARFQAFKFPTSEVVQFRGLVTPCFPHCEPADCQAPGFDGMLRMEESYGKRKKREVHEADVLVAQSVRITDKFEFTPQRRGENHHNNISVEAQGSCSSFTGVVVAGALFLAAQLVMLMAWSYLWHKKRASKQIDPTPPTPSLYMGSNASRVSSCSYLTD